MSNDVVNEMINQHKRSSDNNGGNNQSNKGGVDFKNYFSPMLDKDQKEGQETVRILPNPEGGTPFEEVYFHSFQMEDGSYRKFVCPSKNWGKDCPFCEAASTVRKEASTKDEKNIAKKYDARLYYVVKVIDRKEEDRVKFYRFGHNFRGDGTFDKIVGIIKTKGVDITDPEEGRDITLNLSRNRNGYVVVSSVVDNDPTPLHTDENKKQQFLKENKEKTWTDVYSTKPYDHLRIVVEGGTPVYDKEKQTFVDKNKQDGTKFNKNTSEEEDVNIGGGSDDNTSEPSVSGSDSSSEDKEDDELPF